MLKLDDAMNKVDLELFEAEKSGNLSGQIVALRERAELWRRYGALLRKANREDTGAELSAQRDLNTAHELAQRAL